MVSLPPRLDLARLPTPLQQLTRASAELGIDLWVKRDDLTGHILSGNKIRKLEFVLAEAREKKADTLITCGDLQSNHCRATAAAAAQLGLGCHLILNGRPNDIDGNLFFDRLFGAEITYTDSKDSIHLKHLFRQTEAALQARGRRAFSIPTGASSVMGLWGYALAWQEMQQDFRSAGMSPDLLVTAVGSGGTLAGLFAGQQLYGGALPLVGMGVALDARTQEKLVTRLLRDFQSDAGLNSQDPQVLIDDRYLGAGYAVAGQEIFDILHWLAALEGLVLDPVYTGKAFYGLVQWVREGRIPSGSKVVFLHTGGLFGTLAQRHAIIREEWL